MMTTGERAEGQLEVKKGGGRVELTLEPLLGVQVDLLSLRNVLEHLLHDRAIPVSGVTVRGRVSDGFGVDYEYSVTHLGVSSMW